MCASRQSSIRRAEPAESDVLFDIWWRSVCATHTFLSEDDLEVLAPAVRNLHLELQDTWVLCEASEQPIAFLVLQTITVVATLSIPLASEVVPSARAKPLTIWNRLQRSLGATLSRPCR